MWYNRTLRKTDESLLIFRFIDENAFRDLKILVELDLTKNNITKLRPKTFDGNDGLQTVRLSHNPIGALQVRHKCICFHHNQTMFNLSLFQASKLLCLS